MRDIAAWGIILLGILLSAYLMVRLRRVKSVGKKRFMLAYLASVTGLFLTAVFAGWLDDEHSKTWIALNTLLLPGSLTRVFLNTALLPQWFFANWIAGFVELVLVSASINCILIDKIWRD